ncbi:MAG TPA: pyridoxal 5'-phosphate synthase glutaminase subunit PdxT [Candidatus Dormibacteraeota bacterium]|nr:pyridoxal 5'-phosphate synthase glutaminase subunit PdxT [Candidatus Dormibacteraeota bacterium]
MRPARAPAPKPLIGVLAMQGAFAEHLQALERAGARTRLVRTKADLDGLDGIVLPGGESTTMTMLMERVGLLEPLRDAIRGGLATMGTCAGMIVLARDITDGMADQHGLALLDIAVRRNGYGRQVDSFESPLHIEGMNGTSFPGVFIRAPLVERTGDVEVIAEHDGHAVGVRQDRILALCFHPELTNDLRLHKEFVRMAGARA